MSKITAELQSKIDSLPLNTIVEIKKIYQYKDIIKNPEFILPKTFDGIKVWGNKIIPPWNQESCGSCWAFSTASVLSDRFNIQSLGMMYINLSPVWLLLCNQSGTGSIKYNESNEENNIIQENIKDINNFACFGNTLVNSVEFILIWGLSSIECTPYDKNLGNMKIYQSISKFKEVYQLPLCTDISGNSMDLCSNYVYNTFTGENFGIPAKSYRSFTHYGLHGTSTTNSKGGIEQIQFEIYKWGPICTAFVVYPDFYTFNAKNQIYKWNGKGDKIGGHAVEIIGWGEENGILYWQIKNSWGPNWGNNGYFKMIRGINNCEIEDNCIGIMPDFFYPIGYKHKQKVNIHHLNKDQKDIAKEIIKKANEAINDITQLGGGYDETTGFSRRSMYDYPWTDLARPISLELLPNWNKFIAGNININHTNYLKNYTNKNYNIYIIFGIILIIFIIFIIITIIIFKKITLLYHTK